MAEGTDPGSHGSLEVADPGSRGNLEVADRAIEAVARMAAREVDGVVSGDLSSAHRLFAGNLPTVSVDVAGPHAHVEVSVAVAWPLPLATVSTQVRDQVVRRLDELLQLTADRVDVTVPRLITNDGRAL